MRGAAISQPVERCTAEQLRHLLRQKYAAPAGAVLFELRDGTSDVTSIADAVAMNLWASRGLTAALYEIKVSRSDWLRELKRPAKRESWAAVCHYRWLLAPACVVRSPADELPHGWGWLRPEKNGDSTELVVVVPAARVEPAAWTPGQLAALFRRVSDLAVQSVPLGDVQRQVRERAAELCESRLQLAEQTAARRIEVLERELEALRGSLSAYYEASGGMMLTAASAEEMGRIAATMQAGRPVQLMQRIEGARAAVERALDALNESEQALRGP